MDYFPISVFKERPFVYLFITGKKLTGKVSEYNTRISLQLFLGRSAVKRWLGNDNIYTPHQALANMWWLHNVKPDALSVYLQVQNHLSETLFLIMDLNGITFYHLSYSVFKYLNSTEACWNVHLQIVSRLAEAATNPASKCVPAG